MARSKHQLDEVSKAHCWGLVAVTGVQHAAAGEILEGRYPEAVGECSGCLSCIRPVLLCSWAAAGHVKQACMNMITSSQVSLWPIFSLGCTRLRAGRVGPAQQDFKEPDGCSFCVGWLAVRVSLFADKEC